ncbi:hypothetical protein MHU86_13366 [Fragilaria crotonensis]|nr:hypothetical protein MHU86_13366 [Fragilaria crotonensis]
MISLDNVFDIMERNRTDTEMYEDEVVHNYIDYGNEKNDLFALRSNEFMGSLDVSYPNNRNPKGVMAVPFPVKLHEMLDHIEQDGLSHVVSWQPHGRCFVVHNQQQFVDVIMPHYFKQTKFPSFQRQLNLYGFNRLTSGPDRGGYYHEFFLRGKKFLAIRIQRLKIKGTGVRKPSSPDTEPQFYFMPPILTDVQEDDGVTAKNTSTIHQLPMEGIPLFGSLPSPAPLYTADDDRIQAINRIILNHALASNQMHGLPTVLSELQNIILKQQYSFGHLPSVMKGSTVLPNHQSSLSSLQLPAYTSEWMTAFSEPQAIPSTPMVTIQCQFQNTNQVDVESDDESETNSIVCCRLGELPIEMTTTTVNPLAADHSLANLLDTITE